MRRKRSSDMWGKLIGSVFGLGTQWLDNKKLKSEARAQWEAESARAGSNGWKDEFVTIMVWFPFTTLFLAALFGQEEVMMRVMLAFEYMDKTPDWYQYTFVAVTLAAVGIRMGKEIVGRLKKKD
jgi:hypothetical protein